MIIITFDLKFKPIVDNTIKVIQLAGTLQYYNLQAYILDLFL